MTAVVSFLIGAAVVAIVRWLVERTVAWRERRERRVVRQLNVKVIVDRRRSSRRRMTFWKEILRSHQHDLRYRSKVQMLSIADQLRRNKNPAVELFSHDTDVIVINWDAINADPVYGSDRTHQFLAHYCPDMKGWLARGGVLLVESQGASWAAAQEPYDIFTRMFPDSYVLVSAGVDKLGTGNRAEKYAGSEADPLVAGLEPDDLVLKPGGLWARKGWFPRRFVRSDVASLRFIRRHQNHLYRGWFDGWSQDWTPVIGPADSRREGGSESRAVLVYKRVCEAGGPSSTAPEVGAIILTTLFVASSELYGLISNVLSLRDDLSIEMTEHGEESSD